MPFKSYREESKIGYGSTRPGNVGASLEQINCGSLQRIADATEKMAQYHSEILRDLEYYKKKYFEKRDEIEQLERSRSSLKGVITKLKKAAKK